MKTEYSKEYQNRDWLYTVWRAPDASDHILVAVHPGVGWEDVAVTLSEDEVDILRRSEDDFTTFVKKLVADRNTARITRRRIESKIHMTVFDRMTLEE